MYYFFVNLTLTGEVFFIFLNIFKWAFILNAFEKDKTIAMKSVSFFIFFIVINELAFSQQDTIYYNSQWQICGKGIASFYRIGSVAVGKEWHFTDSVRDYYISNRIQMEGFYSKDGFRDGLFSFYYPDGNLEAQGRFVKDRFYGNWQFYYPEGKRKARVYYSGDAIAFTIVEYIDEEGNYLVKDGTGKFLIPVTDLYGDVNYLLKGEIINGEREGAWEYTGLVNENNTQIKHKEVYNEGKFKRGESSSGEEFYRDYDKPKVAATFMSFKKINNTETFAVSESGNVDIILNNRKLFPSYNPTYGNTRDTIGAMTNVEIEAAFPGGYLAWRKFLEQNLKADILTNSLPASIKNYKQTVQVRFIVCEDGTVCNVEVANKNEGFKPVQDEARRVISRSGKWVPAVHEGKNVKSFHTQLITFIATSE